MMKKAVILGKRKAGLIDVPVPEPKEDWVLVKVHAAPMCTEYKAFLNGDQALMGHEAAGEVVKVAQPGRVEAGDRVVVMPQLPCGKCPLCVSGDYIHCENNYDYREFTGTTGDNATMAQYVLKPSWLLPRIPDGVSYEHASLACCALGPTFNAMQGMQVGAFDTVLITGAGPVGLGGIVNARYRGARVIVVEMEPWRQEKARDLGAHLVLHPQDESVLDQIIEYTGGRGVDAAVDCSGSTQAQRLCIDATRRKGRVTFVGECGEELVIKASADLIRKGLTLMGAWHYNLADFPRVMQVIQNSPVIDGLISHTFPLREIQQAMETCASHKTAKVILKPWE